MCLLCKTSIKFAVYFYLHMCQVVFTELRLNTLFIFYLCLSCTLCSCLEYFDSYHSNSLPVYMFIVNIYTFWTGLPPEFCNFSQAKFPWSVFQTYCKYLPNTLWTKSDLLFLCYVWMKDCIFKNFFCFFWLHFCSLIVLHAIVLICNISSVNVINMFVRTCLKIFCAIFNLCRIICLHQLYFHINYICVQKSVFHTSCNYSLT